jgi:uncharacterized protein
MAKSFWSEGLRFECQGTGNCCVSRGGYGYVYVTLEDRRALARKLGLTTSAFTRRHCRRTGGHFHLKDLKGPCTFLDGKSCSVYEARPTQCRTWPVWPENMNARTWTREVAAFCPGVGKGKLFTPEAIRSLIKTDPLQAD